MVVCPLHVRIHVPRALGQEIRGLSTVKGSSALENKSRLRFELVNNHSGGWKFAIVGVPWRGSVSACLAWGDLFVTSMFERC